MFPTLIVEPALCFTVSLWALAAQGILHSTCAHTCKLRNFILFLYNLIGLQMLHAFSIFLNISQCIVQIMHCKRQVMALVNALIYFLFKWIQFTKGR